MTPITDSAVAVQPPHHGGVKAILTPAWLAVIAVACLFAGACWFVLAPWQFGRHSERDAQNAQIVAAMSAPTIPVTEVLSTTGEPPGESQWRTVSATGTFLAAGQAFVRLRQWRGMDAREVVVPFQLADGTRILVDRGYVATADLDAGATIPALPDGTVTITGRVAVDQPDPSQRPEQLLDGRREVYGIDSAVLLGPGDGARRGMVQLVAGSSGVLAEIGVPDRDDGPFLSYALQWCVFGAVALLAVLFFGYREVTDPYRGATAPTGPPSGHDRRDPRSARFDKSDLYD